MKAIRCLFVYLCTCLAFLSSLLGVSSLSAGPTGAVASRSPDGAKGLVITTHGSGWFFRDDYWRYPAFRDFQESFDLITTVELDQVLEEYPGLSQDPGQTVERNFQLDHSVDDALVFQLSGTSPDFDGLGLTMRVRAPDGVNYRCYQRLSESSLHIDQPMPGVYNLRFRSNTSADFTLRIGTGKSPFLTTELLSYSFLLIPDVDPLTPREIAKVNQFVESGGKLVVLADLIQGESYTSSSIFSALNPLLENCDIQFTGELLTTTHHTTANRQTVNILTNVVPHQITQGVTNVVSTGSTLDLTGSAQGLVFDDEGQPAIAVGSYGQGQCLALGTGIGFNADFGLTENDRLAHNIVLWAEARVPFSIYLPIILRNVGSST